MFGRAKKNAAQDRVDVLAGIHLFGGCTPEELADLARRFDEIERPAGTVLVREGDSGREFYVIVEGTASATIGGRVVKTLGAGDFFGEMALLDRSPRSATLTATSAIELLVMDTDAFSALVSSAPSVGMRMMRALSGRLRAVETTPAGIR